MSGFSVAAARLGLPDTGLVSYGEMVEQGRQMIEATKDIPLIGDGDTGGGNAMNVKRTVKGYAAAGFSGILIEDQTWPKSCGHVRGKRVVSREEAVARVKAACDARDEPGGCGIVIVARTDAKQAVSFQEAIERAELFADAGADVVFVDALESVAEMRTLCAVCKGRCAVMANMLEGGGKTPILSPEELEKMGFKLVAYPLSLLGVSMNAMRRALGDLKRGEIPRDVPEFSDLQEVVGFNAYFQEEARYDVTTGGGETGGRPAARAAPQAPAAIEPDAVIEGDEQGYREGGSARASSSSSSSSSSSAAATYDVTERGDASSRGQGLWLRIKVYNRQNAVALDTRFPAGFLSGIGSIVPQVAGIDLGAIMAEAEGKRNTGEPVYAFELDDERVEIFLE